MRGKYYLKQVGLGMLCFVITMVFIIASILLVNGIVKLSRARTEVVHTQSLDTIITLDHLKDPTLPKLESILLCMPTLQ